ncbi:hypothetical protein C8R44DRAFT_878493 [Mycena epipterygia]|nr:hypothetical protein C8R44DRAFT_878493 [Mycena epipterygia]
MDYQPNFQDSDATTTPTVNRLTTALDRPTWESSPTTAPRSRCSLGNMRTAEWKGVAQGEASLYPDSDGLVPSLTHLALKTSLAFEDQVLLDVIESGWVPWADELYGIPVSRLNSVDLYFCGRKQTLEPSSIKHLRDLSGE